MPEKYAYRVRNLFFAERKKKRMPIYACSVKGNIKQTNESKNFIRISVFFSVHMRKYER